jgi:FKBP-type peptidyl-prolyl cis-trans isomerase SlyD
MKTEKNKVVSITYELRQQDKDGEVLEQVTQESPLTFILGVGALLPAFEEKLTGLEEGDEFNFVLPVADAYGEYSENAVVTVPKEVFVVDGVLQEEMLYEGNTIPMMDEEGNKLNGVVTSVGEEDVKMDFNHPLAGIDLHFHGQVIGIRDATASELEHGHVHE